MERQVRETRKMNFNKLRQLIPACIPPPPPTNEKQPEFHFSFLRQTGLSQPPKDGITFSE